MIRFFWEAIVPKGANNCNLGQNYSRNSTIKGSSEHSCSNANNLFSIFTANSPVYSHLSLTISGLETVRAFKTQKFMYHQYCAHQNLNTSTEFLHISLERWLSINMEAIQCILCVVLVYGSILVNMCKYITPELYIWFRLSIKCCMNSYDSMGVFYKI